MNYTIIINDITKMSFNKYNHLHWTKKKAFKDTLRLMVRRATDLQLKGGYSLNFMFEFKGRKLDSVNTFHYCKIIEDVIFKQDNENRQICTNIIKGQKNKVTLKIIKI